MQIAISKAAWKIKHSEFGNWEFQSDFTQLYLTFLCRVWLYCDADMEDKILIFVAAWKADTSSSESDSGLHSENLILIKASHLLEKLNDAGNALWNKRRNGFMG